jgi:predicted transcriptional regulator
MSLSKSDLHDANRSALDADFSFDVMEGLEPREPKRSLPVPAGPLHGRKPPAQVIQKENAWHRQAAYLFAQGLTQKQIAQAVGKSLAAVSLVFKQPWFQQEVVNIIHNERIEDGAFKLLQNASAAAAMTIINIAAGGENISSATQLKASEAILSRVLGPIGREKVQPTNGAAEGLDEIEILDEQIKTIEEQLTIL